MSASILTRATSSLLAQTTQILMYLLSHVTWQSATGETYILLTTRRLVPPRGYFNLHPDKYVLWWVLWWSVWAETSAPTGGMWAK